LSSPILGLTCPSSSASTDSKTYTTLFSGHQQPSGSQDSFEELQNLQAQPKPPQGYTPQPFSVSHPQPFSVTHSLPSSSLPSYATSLSPVLQVAPVSSTNSQVLPAAPPIGDKGLPGQWSCQSPQHGTVVETSSFHNPVLADPVPSAADISGHQTVPLFETPTLPTSSSLSQLQHGTEVQSTLSSSSSSSSSSVPLLGTFHQQYQPTVQQEKSVPQSILTPFPVVATVSSLGKCKSEAPLSPYIHCTRIQI